MASKPESGDNKKMQVKLAFGMDEHSSWKENPRESMEKYARHYTILELLTSRILDS